MRKTRNLLFCILLVASILYAGYVVFDVYKTTIGLFGIIIYAASLIVLLNTSSNKVKAFYFIFSSSFILILVFESLYLLSELGIELNGGFEKYHMMDYWLLARFIEAIAFMFAIIFFSRKVKKTPIILFNIIFLVILLKLLNDNKLLSEISGIDYWKDKNGVWQAAILIGIMILTTLVLRSKAKNISQTIYTKLLLFAFFKSLSDGSYLFLYNTTGDLIILTYIFRAAYLYMIYRLVIKVFLDDEDRSIFAESRKANAYYKSLFRNIKLGIIVFSFSDTNDEIIFKDINIYAARYFKVARTGFVDQKYKMSELDPVIQEMTGYAKERFGERKSIYFIQKIKNPLSERYIKVQLHPHTGNEKVITFVDITKSIQREQKIRSLVQHDSLTKLYNRNILPEIEKKMKKNIHYPIAVIVGDVNGLKATNDIFGHNEGDRLLKEIAEIIKYSISSDDVCIRYGGDEFLIISYNCDNRQADELIGIMRKRLKKSTVMNFTPNVSFGYSVMMERDDLNDHIAIADQMMYEKKYEDEMVIRKNILRSLIKTLRFKNIESQEHLNSLEKISLMIGNCMDLSKEELEELKLISSLHDIGKISVKYDILIKKGILNEEEWEEVRSHSIHGYNMTESIKEFKGISKYILFHHEQWDGNGYPYGLKGDSIPLLSRIVTIADAFDSMTRDRVYRMKLSKESAMREILRNRGKQFDPVIVDHFLEISDRL